jgi:uncharacterized caspase-like protein
MIELREPKTGLYSAPDWKEGKGGLFAIVIGVSKYTNLVGGEAPAHETYGFSQLATSALTAYRVFEWLRDGYNYTDVPLVRCRLLLSPTDAEVALLAQAASGATKLNEIAGLPTLDNCRRAIRAWRDEMLTLDSDTGAQSRALFFFSGHGIEPSGRSLLLPMDWLGDSAPTPNDALSSQNLAGGLAKVNVPQQWFFCDACRNSTFLLNNFQRLEGIQVLEETLGETFERSYPILYATASGMQAYEPADPQQGCTFFGGALIDGFYGRDASVVSREQTPWRVEFTRLLSFVQAETHKRLTAAGQKPAGVALCGQYLLDNPIVTMLAATHSIAQGNPDARGTEGKGVNRGPGTATRSAWSKASSDFVRGAPVGVVAATLASDLTSFDDHPFGSERLSSFLSGATASWFERLDTSNDHTERRKPLRIDGMMGSAKLGRLDVTLSADSSSCGAWFEFVDSQDSGGDGTVFGLPIPRGVAHFTLVADTDDRCRVVGLALYPKTGGDTPTKASLDLHGLYRLYRVLDPVEAARRVERAVQSLDDGVSLTADDPLADIEAALILLRSSRFALLYENPGAKPTTSQADWLADLAERFDGVSDACVLVAQRLVSDASRTGDQERLTKLVGQIATRGIPATAEAIFYLLNFVRTVGRHTVIDRVAGIEDELVGLKDLVASSRIADAVLETSGLFALFGASADPESRAAYEAAKSSYFAFMSPDGSETA